MAEGADLELVEAGGLSDLSGGGSGSMNGGGAGMDWDDVGDVVGESGVPGRLHGQYKMTESAIATGGVEGGGVAVELCLSYLEGGVRGDSSALGDRSENRDGKNRQDGGFSVAHDGAMMVWRQGRRSSISYQTINQHEGKTRKSQNGDRCLIRL